MNLSISKLFLAVAKGAILNPPTNIDKSAIQEWEKKISDTEKKIKLSDLPIYFFNGTTCSFDKNPYGDYLYFIKRDCFIRERTSTALIFKRCLTIWIWVIYPPLSSRICRDSVEIIFKSAITPIPIFPIGISVLLLSTIVWIVPTERIS